MEKFRRNARLKKHKDIIVLFILIVISVILYVFSVNGSKFGGLFSDFIGSSLYNTYRVADYPLNLSERLYENYLNVLSVKSDNKLLKAKIEFARYKLNKYKAYQIENEKLKALLFLRKALHKKSISATVTFHGIEGWLNSFYINRGRKDGIQVGTGVFSYSGVVGRVVYETDNYAKVIPITNPRCIFSVVDANTGTLGVARGLGNGYIKMRFVFNSQKIDVGDKILTSGLGGVFASGINVGKVFAVNRKSYKIFQKITIIPYKNLFNAKYVLVEE